MKAVTVPVCNRIDFESENLIFTVSNNNTNRLQIYNLTIQFNTSYHNMTKTFLTKLLY